MRAIRARNRMAAAGFTLLELMIVVTIILILLTMAAGNYQKSVLRSREAALKQDLFVMRQAIQQYTLDKLAGPQSLEELVGAGYLREVPVDPMTQQKDWRVVFGEELLSPDQTLPGITDVFSNSDQVSPFTGTPYNQW